MPKITLKAVQERLTILTDKMKTYVHNVRYPEVTTHSKTGMIVTRGETKGKATVTIEELIVTAKTAEILGKNTLIRATDSGTALEILFVTKASTMTPPEELYA